MTLDLFASTLKAWIWFHHVYKFCYFWSTRLFRKLKMFPVYCCFLKHRMAGVVKFFNILVSLTVHIGWTHSTQRNLQYILFKHQKLNFSLIGSHSETLCSIPTFVKSHVRKNISFKVRLQIQVFFWVQGDKHLTLWFKTSLLVYPKKSKMSKKKTKKISFLFFGQLFFSNEISLFYKIQASKLR